MSLKNSNDYQVDNIVNQVESLPEEEKRATINEDINS